MNITAEEQVGLEAVLRLTATVADKVYLVHIKEIKMFCVFRHFECKPMEKHTKRYRMVWQH